MTVRLKRVYEAPSAKDGARVLVDRLWPRGLTKGAAALDAWLKDIAPSHELRKWYHAHSSQWMKFRKQYLSELSNDAAHAGLQQLHDLAGKRKGVTLLFAARDLEKNHALVLKELVEGERKPPTGTGRAAAVAARVRAARKR